MKVLNKILIISTVFLFSNCDSNSGIDEVYSNQTSSDTTKASSFDDSMDLIENGTESEPIFFISKIYSTDLVKNLNKNLRKKDKIVYFLESKDSTSFDLRIGIDNEIMYLQKYTFKFNMVDSNIYYVDYVKDTLTLIYAHNK